MDQKPWVNPLEKWQFLDFFKFLFLQHRKAFFRSRISQKTFFWPILPKKKKLEKWPFLDKNHRLTPLEKCELLDLLDFLFLQRGKPWHKLPKKKRFKKWPFLAHTMGQPLWKNVNFSNFKLFFIAQKGAFSFQNIVKDIFLAYIA